ncbi:MAG TPA: ABC transporter permease [Micromonosporaceae bacterium]|jgi:ABC-2 type transport system permease protein
MNPTIITLTLRALLGRTRALLLIPLPLILIGLTLVGHLVHPDATDWQRPIIIGLGFAVIVPIVSLIVGSSVIGSEIDDGTIVHILTKPIPRSEIVLSKLAVAAGITGLVNGAMLFVCGWIITGPRLAVGLGVGGAIASVCYSALFVALSLVSRRPVLIGLVYILLWEGLLTNLLTGTRSLSIEQFGVTLSARIGGSDLFPPSLSTVTAVVMSLVFLVAATAIAIDRLRAFTMRGETS